MYETLLAFQIGKVDWLKTLRVTDLEDEIVFEKMTKYRSSRLILLWCGDFFCRAI
jgi:hypothetical protein